MGTTPITIRRMATAAINKPRTAPESQTVSL